MDEREAHAELAEALDRLSADLHRLLEEQQKPGQLDPDLLNAVFREAHSIKGLAGLFAEVRLGSLAHATEDLLDALRMGRVTWSDELEELLAAVPEALAERLEAGDAGRAAPGERGLLEDRVRLALEEGAIRPRSAERASDAPLEIKTLLTTYEEHRLSENLSIGYGLCAVRVRLPLASFDRDLRALRSRVQALGEVIATLPLPEEMTAETLACELLLASPRQAEDLSRELGNLEIRVLRASRAPAAETSASVVQTVRVDVRKLDRMVELLRGLGLSRRRLAEIGAQLGQAAAPDPLLAELLRELGQLEQRFGELQAVALGARLVPLTPLLTRTKRMAARLAQGLGKELDIELAGGEIEIDKVLADALAEPLVHLVHNAVDHGIEKPAAREALGKPRRGKLSLRASQRGGQVLLEVTDDGAGIDPVCVRRAAEARGLLSPTEGEVLSHRELVRLLLTPGFSTAACVSQVSGRGVGLDAVHERITSFHGSLEVESEVGHGSRFLVALPAR